jgi:sirohydrochlorin ferrochelatase
MQAIVFLGHGSLRGASGASMIRCAARLRARGLAPVVAPAFLNYCRPTLAEAVVRCRARGASQILVQPYFLIAGVYVCQELPALVASVAAQHPELTFAVGDVLGAHPALVRLAHRRVKAAVETLPPPGPCGLLLMAHGTPLPAANAPLYQVAAQVAALGGFAHHRVAYLDCNRPEIPAALPYFLHLGRHVREDLPARLTQAQAALPQMTIVPANPLNYDPLLVDALAERVEHQLRQSHLSGALSKPPGR